MWMENVAQFNALPGCLLGETRKTTETLSNFFFGVLIELRNIHLLNTGQK